MKQRTCETRGRVMTPNATALDWRWTLPDFLDFFMAAYGLSREKPLTDMEVIRW